MAGERRVDPADRAARAYCHQHVEAAIKQHKDQITNIWSFGHQTEKISSHLLKKHEFPIEPGSNYLFRVGLGGPQGHHNGAFARPHFAIIEHDPKKVVLFEVE